MNIRMHKELCEAIGIDRLKKHGLRVDRDELTSWKKYVDVDLQPLTSKQVKMLRDLIAPYGPEKGIAAVRVAVTSFHNEMGDPKALGNDQTGRAITAGYRVNLSKVLGYMRGMGKAALTPAR